MGQFVTWESLEVRVDGAKMNAMAREMIASDPLVERVHLRFFEGLLRVEGAVRKFISVPFSVEVTRIEAQGTTVRIPLGRVSAGPIPVPLLVVSLARDFFPKDLVKVEETATLVLSLDRFLPPFVSADVRKVRIVDGGLAVTLGPGGADLPTGGFDVQSRG